MSNRGRPKKAVCRDKALRVYVTQAELDQVNQMAVDAGVTVSQLVRDILLRQTYAKKA